MDRVGGDGAHGGDAEAVPSSGGDEGVERGKQELTAEAADSFKIFDDNDGYGDGYGDGDDETGSTASNDPHEGEGAGSVEGEGAAASHRTAEDDANADGTEEDQWPPGVEHVPEPKVRRCKLNR